MPRESPTSYDEIVRSCVPEPDLSLRPSREEQELSEHRFGEMTEHRPHPLSWAERDVLARVRAALAAERTLDLSSVEVEVDRRVIVLSGVVPGPSTKIRAEDVVTAIDGVDRVDNQLICRSARR